LVRGAWCLVVLGALCLRGAQLCATGGVCHSRSSPGLVTGVRGRRGRESGPALILCRNRID